MVVGTAPAAPAAVATPRRSPPGRATRRRRPADTRSVTAAALLLAVVGGLAAGWGSPPVVAVLALPLLVAGTEVTIPGLLPGRARWAEVATEACVAGALTVSPGGWVVASTFAGALLAQGARRWPRRRAVAAGVRLVAGSGAAAVVGAAVTAVPGLGPVAGAAAAMTAWWAVAHVLTVLSVARTTGRRARRLLATRAAPSFAYAAAGAALGITAGWLLGHAPAGLLGLLVPLLLLGSFTRQAAQQASEASLFAELARGGGAPAGGSTDEAAQLLVTSSARLLGGADVDLVVLGAEGAVRYSGRESGVATRLRVDPDALDEPWLLTALGSGSSVRSGVEAGRPVLTVLLEAAGAPLAVLAARRPRGGAAFGRGESVLVEVLAGQAAGWLARGPGAPQRRRDDPARGATPADWQPADHTDPAASALAVLREAAVRLARLVTRESGQVDAAAVVEELHVVETSVAAVLGALATPAAGPASALPPPRAGGSLDDPGTGSDWTTTGVLQ